MWFEPTGAPEIDLGVKMAITSTPMKPGTDWCQLGRAIRHRADQPGHDRGCHPLGSQEDNESRCRPPIAPATEAIKAPISIEKKR